MNYIIMCLDYKKSWPYAGRQRKCLILSPHNQKGELNSDVEKCTKLFSEFQKTRIIHQSAIRQNIDLFLIDGFNRKNAIQSHAFPFSFAPICPLPHDVIIILQIVRCFLVASWATLFIWLLITIIWRIASAGSSCALSCFGFPQCTLYKNIIQLYGFPVRADYEHERADYRHFAFLWQNLSRLSTFPAFYVIFYIERTT